MDLMNDFMSSYGTTILYTALVAIFGFLGTAFKKIYEKYVNDKTKKDVAKTCVKAVQQIYYDLGGEEKYEKCTEAISLMLEEKGIGITQLEIKMLVEAAVTELKTSFNKVESEEESEEVE